LLPAAAALAPLPVLLPAAAFADGGRFATLFFLVEHPVSTVANTNAESTTPVVRLPSWSMSFLRPARVAEAATLVGTLRAATTPRHQQ
jgi:hypothetical protein